MRFLYYGDAHMDKNPSSRTDVFEETRKKKIDEILLLAKKYEVRALLQGGDFLDKGTISSENLSKVFQLWQGANFNEIIMDILIGNKSIKDLEKILKEKQAIPTIGVAGNHELIGGDITSLNKTSLNLLVKSGFMRLATKENPIIFKDEDGFTVAITGSNYSHDMDDEEDRSAYIVEEKIGDFHIHIVHGNLMDKSYGNKFKHTVITDIAYKTKADLTINGHDHIGYDLNEIDGKLFINPGSPFRFTADKKEINRMPKVVIIDVSSRGVNIKTEYLTTAQKGSDVLSRKHIEKKKEKEELIEEIKSLINKATIGKGIDILQIIDEIVKTKGISENIKEEVKNLIIEQMNKLDEPFNPKGEYIIERIEIENFLCHKYTETDLSEGLNVFYGQSRSGKSSILRAIREVMECYIRNPRDYIFLNEDYFKITLYLSNGYIISRIVERSKRGRNGYDIYDPNTGEFGKYNTKAVSMVQEILGFNKVKLTPKNKIDINSTIQGDGWFFLSNELSAPDKAKLTGIVYGTHYGDAVLKNLNVDAKKVVSQMNFQQKEIDNLTEKTKDYNYLNQYEEDLNKAEDILKEAISIEEEVNKIKKLKERKLNIEKELILIDSIVKSLSENEKEINSKYENIKKAIDELETIKEKSSELKNIVKDGKLASAIAKKLHNINKADIILSEIKELIESLEKDKEIRRKYKELNLEKDNIIVNIKHCDKVINSLENLDVVIEIYKNANNLNEQLTSIKKNKNELRMLKNQIEETKEEEEKITKKVLVDIDEYKMILENMGTCPVCSSKIDNLIISNVIDGLLTNFKKIEERI